MLWLPDRRRLQELDRQEPLAEAEARQELDAWLLKRSR